MQKDRHLSLQLGSGFTLSNLMVTLAISGMLAITGLPSLNQLSANKKADNVYYRLFDLVQYTRIQAVNYRSQVLLCPSANQIDCVNDWSLPLMVFVYSNDDETRNPNEAILQIAEEILDDNEQLHWQASGSNRYLRYKADGATRNQNGRLSYCLTAGERLYARQIIMYRSGRARKGSEKEATKRC